MSDLPDPTENTRPLQGRQLAFVDQYLVDFNAVQAARRAGYCTAGTSAGVRLLHNPRIKAEINRRCLAAQVRLQIKSDDVLHGFACIAFDPRKDDAGGPTRTERMLALDRLAKIFGMYQLEKPPAYGTSLEQLLAAANALESKMPEASPPLRLIEGGKV